MMIQYDIEAAVRQQLRHALVNLRVAARVSQLENDFTASADTVPVPVVKATRKLCPLPLDADGRASVRRTDPLVETYQIIEWAVEDFYRVMKSLPAIISLNQARWHEWEMGGTFSLWGKDIPLVLSDEQECEVCCKSGVLR